MMTRGRLRAVLDRPVLNGLGEATDGGQRRAQIVRDRQEEMALPGAAVLQALRHVVDGAGERGELGIVAAADGDPAGQLARGDAACHLHRLDQRAGHASAHLPRHQRGHDQRRAPGDDEVAPARPEAADVAGREDGERPFERDAPARLQARALRVDSLTGAMA